MLVSSVPVEIRFRGDARIKPQHSSRASATGPLTGAKVIWQSKLQPFAGEVSLKHCHTLLYLRYEDARRLRRLWWIAFCNPCTWVIPQKQTNNTALQAGRYAQARHLPCPGVQPTVPGVCLAQPALSSALHQAFINLGVHIVTSHRVGSGGDGVPPCLQFPSFPYQSRITTPPPHSRSVYRRFMIVKYLVLILLSIL